MVAQLDDILTASSPKDKREEDTLVTIYARG